MLESQSWLLTSAEGGDSGEKGWPAVLPFTWTT